MGDILRYFGIGKETAFRTPAEAVFYADLADGSLDSPKAPWVEVPSGLGRYASRKAPVGYQAVGNVNMPIDLGMLYYFLWLMLGSKDTDDVGVVAKTETKTPGHGITVLNFTAANIPIVPGSLTVKILTVLQAADNGCGLIIPDGQNTEIGTINYATGAIHMEALTPETAYIFGYDSGQYVHTITQEASLVLPSATVRLGKDLFEHIFPGQALTKLTMKLDNKGLCSAQLAFSGGEDTKGTIVERADLLIPQGYPLAFHNAQFKLAEYGEVLEDISAKVYSLNLELDMGHDKAGGFALGSRFPQKEVAGEIKCSGDLELEFDSTDMKEAFWGGASGPGNVPKDMVGQVLFDSGDYGDAQIDLFKLHIMQAGITPKGRAKFNQAIAFDVQYNNEENPFLGVLVNSIFNYPPLPA
jgi:hypothetical protein